MAAGGGAAAPRGEIAEQPREQLRDQPQEADRPLYRSELTTRRLVRWLAGLPVGTSTKRCYRSGVSSFFQYLKLVGVLHRNPMRDVDAPAAGPPRERYLDHGDVLRLVEAQAEPYRTVSALIHGAGLELTVALGLTRADVDTERRRVRARGTKMARRQGKRARDRYARVEAWAWAYLERHLAANPGLPAADLFPGVSPKMARARHREACRRLGITNYRPHDARHTYAVRAIRAGASPRVVSKQLGHVDEQMVMRVYAKHEPDDSDYHWEETAAARDAGAKRPERPERPERVDTQPEHPDHCEARSP
jgi:integrase